MPQPALRREDQPVVEHRCGDSLHIVRTHIAAAPYGGHRLRCAKQGDRGSRAPAEAQLLMVAGEMHNLQQVFPHLLVDMHSPHRLLAGDELVGADHRLQSIDRMLAFQHAEHLQLVIERRVAQCEPHQEAIELGFRQRKRALVVDGVLGGDHQKGPRQLAGFAVDRHSAFRHRLQQRRLRAGRGPVDLVGEHDLRKDRTGAKLKLTGLLVEDRAAGHIGRQQVGGALDAFKAAADAAGQGPGEHRFGHPGHILQQQVPLAEPGHHREDQLLPLPDDRLLDVGDQFLGGLFDVDHGVSLLRGRRRPRRPRTPWGDCRPSRQSRPPESTSGAATGHTATV